MTTVPHGPSIAATAIAISFISLLVSLTALWYSSLSPANIKASVSSPMFLWRADSETPISGTEQSKPKLMIKATCAFSNGGAHIGVISYLVLRLESDDGTKWLFAPYWVVDDAKLITDGFAKRTWASESFHSVAVPGKQTVAYSYMFVAESGLPNFSDATLTPHKFHVTLLTWSVGDLNPHQQQLSTLDFDRDLIDNIRRGVIFGMPFVEQQKQVQMLK